MINNIQDQIEELTMYAENGDNCPLSTYIRLKELADFLSTRIEYIKPIALKEAEKYKGDKNGYFGYIIDVREVGGKYDYSHIESIVKLKEQLKELEKASQNAYKISLSAGLVVTGDGEEVIPANYKPGTTTIVLKEKK